MNESNSGEDGQAAEWAKALAKLPHGREFRFLDRLTALNLGVSGEGEWVVRGDEEFLRGHFPGSPLVPGVIMIEALAQLAGVVFCSDPENAGVDGLLLTAVRSVKISGTAGPGETLRVSAKITGSLGGMVQASGSVATGGKQLMRGEIVLVGG